MNDLIILEGNIDRDFRNVQNGLTNLESEMQQLRRTAIHGQRRNFNRPTCYVNERLYLDIRTKIANINECILLLETESRSDGRERNENIQQENSRIQRDIDYINRCTIQELKASGRVQDYLMLEKVKNHEGSITHSNKILDDITKRSNAFMKKSKENLEWWKKLIKEKYHNELANLRQAEEVTKLRQKHKERVHNQFNKIQSENELPGILPNIKVTIQKEFHDHEQRMDNLMKELHTIQVLQDQYEDEVRSLQNQLAKSRDTKRNMDKIAHQLTTRIQTQLETQKKIKSQYSRLKKDLQA